MITLAVAAILAMIAVPNFRHLLVSMHLSDLGSSLSGDLEYARTEAVSRQVQVQVASSVGGWQDGWNVLAAPASTSPTTPWIVLRRHPAVDTQYVVDAAPATSVVYQPQGSAKAAACFTLSAPKTNNTPIFLQVSASGLLQQSTDIETPPPLCPAPTP